MHPIVNEIRNALREHYPDSEALALAKMLLVEAFGFSTLELYGGKDKEISGKRLDVLNEMIARLKKNEPIQYVIGAEVFCGWTFEVNENVLIPRPETQELVRWIEADWKSDAPCRILDVGTGSGCIAISLSKLLEGAEVEAWDISEGALRVARRNADRNEAQVFFRRVDVLKACTEDCRYDVIVSNPPYITESEKQDMDANVLDWEPHTALFVPDADPLFFYRRIAELGVSMLNEGGALYFEINRAYGEETVRMLEGLGYKQIELRKDNWGNDRMIKANR
ncbi:MAG: peptide chain release factor N(5)-glutamine methyltransferase [Bacteroidaceae bacterium]|nr:peptide chain release factor N(5)-glutamine methyltransferase [Bacteroidaceae bacterium]